MNRMHLGTYGILIKDEKILLIKKSRGPYTGKLDLPGGRLEHGEEVLDGLAREIQEETGVKMKKAVFFQNATTVVEYQDNEGDVSLYHIGLIYHVVDFSNDQPIGEMTVEDSLGSAWYDLATLKDDSLSPFAALAVKELRQ